VLVQELIVVALMFPSCTNPLPCEAPKFDPMIVTGVTPGVPLVGETELTIGAGPLGGGGGTVTWNVVIVQPGWPSTPYWMVMVADPGPTAVITPLAAMVTTDGVSEVYVTREEFLRERMEPSAKVP
jgi:hypothetical protein